MAPTAAIADKALTTAGSSGRYVRIVSNGVLSGAFEIEEEEELLNGFQEDEDIEVEVELVEDEEDEAVLLGVRKEGRFSHIEGTKTILELGIGWTRGMMVAARGISLSLGLDMIAVILSINGA